MVMSMINIREVRMLVHHLHMFMQMFMRQRAVLLEIMPMIVMLVVVDVPVCVRHGLMRVVVLMVFGEMQPNPYRHQRGSHPER